MVDLTEISAVVAAAGVLVGVAYYIMDMRHQTRISQTDMLWKIYASMNTKEFTEAVLKVTALTYKNYRDFEEKYGQLFSETPVSVAFEMVGNLYEGVGLLLHRKLIDLELASEFLPIDFAWTKMKPIVEGARKQYNFPSLYDHFEYLYNEMKKREQRQATKTA
jgi:hypothetical protein